MSQFAAELCELLITDAFGELYSLIFSYLLLHGRQPLRRIVEHTRLSPEQVRHGLVVLVQQHLIFHNASLDDGVTYYDANWKAAYALVRTGKVTQLVEERLGKYAAKVMAVILKLGHVRISDLENAPELRPSTAANRGPVAKVNGVNGVYGTGGEAEKHVKRGKRAAVGGNTRVNTNGDGGDSVCPRLHRTLRQLVSYGYIMRVRDAHFRSPADNRQAAFEAAKASPNVQLLKGRKLQDAIDEKTQSLLDEWTDGTIAHEPPSDAPPRGIKRRIRTSKAPGQPRKRVKVEHVMSDADTDRDEDSETEYVDDIAPLDGNLVIRVNYDKFDVSFRNRSLVELAEQHTTRVTSYVYDALLARVERKIPCCRTQGQSIREGEEIGPYSAAMPLHTLLSDLDEQLDLGGAIAGVGGPPLPEAKGALTNGVAEDAYDPGEDEYADNDEEDDHQQNTSAYSVGSRPWQLEQHLCLLAQEPHHFAVRISQPGTVNWAVEFRQVARRLRHLELERLIEARFGSVAVRVIRILAAKGKLDEKRLQGISMMALTDLHRILAQMETAGFIDLQEVPRDAQRLPSRTIYLWFYDPDRVCTMVLDDIYKAMSRCLQRLNIERQRLKFLLEKAERTDVKANRERYLSVAERKTLDDWHNKEALLLGEVGRLDEMVAVLRDY